MQSLGLRKQYGKKDSEVSQFLKKIFGLSPLPQAEVCDCFALEFLSNLPNDKRVEQFRQTPASAVYRGLKKYWKIKEINGS
jgi:hypothetical protein